jgi:DNA-binding XRE family transcriptional regulator
MARLHPYSRKNTPLARARLARNWSQDQVAQLLGVPKATYADWEGGRREPNFKTAATIARIFGGTIEELFLGEKGGPPP